VDVFPVLPEVACVAVRLPGVWEQLMAARSDQARASAVSRALSQAGLRPAARGREGLQVRASMGATRISADFDSERHAASALENARAALEGAGYSIQSVEDAIYVSKEGAT
jgi:hypothetical protein